MGLLSNPSDGPYEAVVATGRGRGYHDGHGVDDDGGGRGRGHGKQLEASGDATTNAWICPSARGDSGPKQWRYFKSLCFPFTKLDPSRSPFLYPSSIRGGLDPSGLGRGGWRGYSLWNGREREKERAPTVVLACNPGYVDESSYRTSGLVMRGAAIDLMVQFLLRLTVCGVPSMTVPSSRPVLPRIRSPPCLGRAYSEGRHDPSWESKVGT